MKISPASSAAKLKVALVKLQHEVRDRVTELEVTGTAMESAVMTYWFVTGPGQDAVPHQLMGVSKEYMVEAKEPTAEFQTRGEAEAVGRLVPR